MTPAALSRMMRKFPRADQQLTAQNLAQVQTLAMAYAAALAALRAVAPEMAAAVEGPETQPVERPPVPVGPWEGVKQ